ncbi:MAG: hypothetical protein ACC645_06495 [Pirellulales bacterium]
MFASAIRACCASSQRWLSTWTVVAVLAATLLGTPAVALGQSPNVMQVEEDWELVLASPSTIKTAPQLETVISPGGDLSSIFARTTWNYREEPAFLAGGMQLQAWQGSAFLAMTNFGSNDLSTVSETVRWTQSINTDGTVLTLQISNGQSTTWGAFGGSSLTLQGVVNIANLDAYNTAVSVANSGITFGSNRVDLLRITEVRRYDASGNLLSTDTVSKTVYLRQ